MFEKNPLYAQAILSIICELHKNNIPYTPRPLYEGWQIRFPWTSGDAACHYGTYSSGMGMVETYQFPWDKNDVSVLTPEECAKRIIDYYKKITSL